MKIIDKNAVGLKCKFFEKAVDITHIIINTQ